MARRLGRNSKVLRVLYDDPIIIPHDPQPAEETPLPADNGDWTGLVLIGGSIVVLFCLWWLVPDWMETVWKNLIRHIFYFAGQ